MTTGFEGELIVGKKDRYQVSLTAPDNSSADATILFGSELQATIGIRDLSNSEGTVGTLSAEVFRDGEEEPLMDEMESIVATTNHPDKAKTVSFREGQYQLVGTLYSKHNTAKFAKKK